MSRFKIYDRLFSDSLVISCTIRGNKVDARNHYSKARVVAIYIGDKIIQPSEDYSVIAKFLNDKYYPSMLFIYGCDKLRCQFFADGLSNAIMKIQCTGIGVDTLVMQTNEPSFPLESEMKKIKKSALGCFTLKYALCSE